MLAASWSQLCHGLGVSEARCDAVWRDIITAYGEPQRHYHGLSHIEAVVDQAAQRRGLFNDPDTALLALFFHDIVYDPARHDNEAQSAVALRDSLPEIDEARLGRACGHILATQGHEHQEDDDTNLVLDIDMAILGAPWDAYRAYAEGVWREYLPVYGAEAYARGRVELFLKPTLQRDHLFLTDGFTSLEDQARRNLRDEIDLWASGGF